MGQLFFWNGLIFWILTGVGLVSAIAALTVIKSGYSKSTNGVAIIFALVMVVLLGWFPIDFGTSSDKANYAGVFYGISQLDVGALGYKPNEIGFTLINYFLSKFCDVYQFFVVIAIIYIGNYYIALRRMVGSQVYWLLIAVALSLGFVSYNTNTMRGGLALSFVILALSMYPSKLKMLICMVVAASIHNSSIIPSTMIMVSCFYTRTRLYYWLWLLAVPVSFVAGNFFNVLFSGIGDDARASYLTGANEHYKIGFRIDFIVYSMIPMLVGAYYIFKCKISDSFYRMMYNSYLLTNIFWILVIRANFSDRFAYLSWCMIPIVLVYPLLKRPSPVASPGKWVALILLGETIFRSII